MEEFIFAPEHDYSKDEQVQKSGKKPWRIAVVDDEENIHKVTKFALSDFSFEGRPLEFVDAFSGEEARRLFKDYDDIAVVLLDVVMESEHAGLDTARFIREELRNTSVRIVLRTGQPGQAPERDVISEYDINDYKEKTELTSRKLYTLMYSCLRSYRDILALDESRKGLERVIQASKNIYEKRFFDEFTAGVLQQITSILHIDEDAFFGKLEGLTAQDHDGECRVVAGTGMFGEKSGERVSDLLDRDFIELINSTDDSRGLHKGDQYLTISKGQDGQKNVLFLSGIKEQNQLDSHLIELFCDNVLIAFDNLYLKDQLVETQKELVYRLGEAVESRSRETGNHVKRVAAISRLLGRALGMSEARAEVLHYASPLHDLGKIGIPDAILNKPGKLDDAEWQVMKSHASIGHDLLGDSKREILQVGALVSLQHHEKWDGSGYPEGLQGQEIALEARITSVADVYDALASDRVYKQAWPLEKVNQHMQEQAGKHFDPQVIAALFENLDEITAIRTRYVDKFSGIDDVAS
ncbi:DUF3369 domain-containing protein [Agaribacterium haliotis]|uniref:DUF3369 domain-containing protein n=1 Tax=Agaribacterium haliotis TaxID=2013869 RepID=UPI000BB539BD|nr:DUF3369 domain-containing protein [Agaribacterium haliotis]